MNTEKYKKIIEELKDLTADEINDKFSSTILDDWLGNKADITFFTAYHDYLKDNPEKDINGKIVKICEDKILEKNYVQADGTEKEQIGKQIDARTKQNLKGTIKDYKDANPKRSVNIPEEKIMKKTNDLGLSTEDKKIVINFVVDPSVGQIKTTPLISIPKSKYRTLRNTITKYLKWLANKNYKVEPEDLKNSKGEKQDVVYIKHGEIFNITLSCTSLVKEAINKGVSRIKKARKWIEDTNEGIKKTVSKISERRKEKRAARNAKLKNAFASVIDFAGDVAENLSDRLEDLSIIEHEKAEEMKATPVDDIKERLDDLKKKRGVAVSGDKLELIAPPEVDAQMHI